MRSYKSRIKYALLAPLFILSTLVMQFANVSFVSAATITWDGGGGDGVFSTATNWVGGTVPSASDDLVFPSAGGSDITLTNDLGISFASLTVNSGGGTAGSYTLDTLNLIDSGTVEVDTTSGTDTQLNIAAVSGAGSLTIDGNDLLDITTSLAVTTNLAVSSAFDATAAGTFTVGGNLTSSATFAATTVAVTGNATFGTAAPTITTLSANNLTVNDADLSVTTLTLSGDFLAASTNDLTVTGTFTASSNYVVAKAFTANAFTAQGNLTINVAPSVATQITVAGDLTSSAAFTTDTVAVTGDATFDTAAPTITTLSAADLTVNDADLSVTTLTLTGDLLAASTNDLTVTGTFTASAATYTVSESFTAGTFNASGNLVVDNSFTATTTGVTGDLTNSTSFSPGALTVGGNLAVDSTFTATSTDVTGNVTNSTSFSPGALTVGGDLVVNSSFAASSADITGDATVAYDQTLTVSNDMDVDGTILGSGSVSVNGTLTVDSDLTTTGYISADTLHVTGDLTASTYIYVTNITVDGSVQVNYETISISGVYTVGGDLTIGSESSEGKATLRDGSDITGDVTVIDGTFTQADDATIAINSLTVNNGQRADLNGTIDFPITFGSGKSKSLPALAYNSYDTEFDDDLMRSLFTETANTKFIGNVTLKNDLQVYIWGDKKNGKVEFNGDITYNDFEIRKHNSSSGKLYIDGKEIKNPAITTEYNGIKWDSSETVTENETATLSGNRNQIYAFPGGVVKGEGSAVSGVFLHDATLSPGNSPGTITFLNTLLLEPDSVLYAELQNTDTYDQVVVGEDYIGTGNAVDITDATLTLALYEGYSIQAGDEFTIIDNKSDSDVEGTFAGLAEGATIELGGGEFTISYVGGDGNDVVVTVTTVPTATVGAPNTGVLRLVTANPLVSLTLGLTTAGILMLIARRKLATAQVR